MDVGQSGESQNRECSFLGFPKETKHPKRVREENMCISIFMCMYTYIYIYTYIYTYIYIYIYVYNEHRLPYTSRRRKQLGEDPKVSPRPPRPSRPIPSVSALPSACPLASKLSTSFLVTKRTCRSSPESNERTGPRERSSFMAREIAPLGF